MKRVLFCGLMLASLWTTQGTFSNELMGSPSSVATATSAVRSWAWQSGTVVKIDARSGELVLDGARRFTFSPGGGLIVRQSNGAPANLAEVKVGAGVRLKVISSAGYTSSPVTELLIVK